MRPVLLLLVATIAASEQPGSAQTRPRQYAPDWTQPATPHRVAGPVYFVGTRGIASFLITTEAGHILLDPGLEETLPLLKASITTLGFKYEDIEVLLNSHAHYDHAASLARIKRETGARLDVMAEDAVLLAAGGRGDFVLGEEYMFQPVVADRQLRDGDLIALGGVSLTARHTPGHTKGATTFVMTAVDDGQAHQVVFATSTTVNPGTRLLDNPNYPAIVSDWQRTYAILDALSPGVWVSAHSGVFDMAAKRARIGSGRGNPYVDPAGYRRFLAAGRDRFAKLLAEELAAR
jgi:metallo-beta-lactamase class B